PVLVFYLSMRSVSLRCPKGDVKASRRLRGHQYLASPGWRRFGGLGRGRLEEDDELIRKLAQQAKLPLIRVKHFSRQLRRINAEKQARGKSRPREDDRLSIDARSRGLQFHRRQRERHMMNGEARNRRTRKTNSEQPGPKEDEQAAERARLEELLQRHDRLRAAVDAFRRHKQKTLDPSKLEYRLAKPTDVLLSDKLEDKAAVFVAFDTEAQTVVGSVEFGVVQEAVYENKETVFLPWLEMMRGWTNQDVAVEMLKHLLEYIKRVRPRVAYVWTRENWGAKEEFADKVCKKAGFKTMGAPDQWYDYMYTFPKTESSVEAGDGGDGVIPLIPGPYDVVE
ncbi:hypothetical protein FOZ62_017621, partial [Perkinsus olseni]